MGGPEHRSGILKSILPQVRLKASVCVPQHPPGDLDKPVTSPSHALRFQVDEKIVEKIVEIVEIVEKIAPL